MNALCRPSEIRIPNDPALAVAAARFVAEIARVIGFTEPETRTVEQGLLTAVTTLIQYSFEPGEHADLVISCEQVPEGLSVTLRDKGLPFGPEEVTPGGGVCSTGSGSGFCTRVFGLREQFDEVRLHSMGMDGKETVLIKHRKSRSVDDPGAACDLVPGVGNVPAPENPRWTVRQIHPEEAPEIARLVYRAYGYTYPHDYVYYPERVAALNEAGSIHSAVAIAEGKEIAGQCILQFPQEHPRIAELAQAVVKPEYRSRGCLQAMTHYLVRVAGEMRLHGLFTKAVTEHPFSQRSAHRFGFRDCGIFLGMIPQNTPFKGLSEPLPYRGTLLLQFRYLQRGPETTCFVPPRHREMITRIFGNLGLARVLRTDPGSAAAASDRSILKTHAAGNMQFARMIIERGGADGVDQLRAELKGLLVQGFEIIHLYLDLSDPWTIRLSADFEGLGFFLAGLLPEAFPRGDALILQYLDHPPVSYDAVVVETGIAREMLAYIRSLDPNRP